MEWFNIFTIADKKDREKIADVAENFFDFLKGKKSRIGVTPFIEYIPLKSSTNHDYQNIILKQNFNSPVVLYHLTGTPFLILNGASIKTNDLDQSNANHDETLFTYARLLANTDKKERNAIKKLVIDGIRIFKKGKKSKLGEKLADFLESNKVEIIGFAPNIYYMMINPKEDEFMNVLWKHDFSSPCLLAKVKGTSFFLLTNGNIDYNYSKLLENTDNANDKALKNIRGIIG